MNPVYPATAMNATPGGDLSAAIVSDPRAVLPQLHQLLAGYFHQDWNDEGNTWTEVVDDFLAETPRTAVVATADDLRRLLDAGLDEPTLRWLLDSLDCNLEPAGVGLDPGSWLRAVLERIDS